MNGNLGLSRHVRKYHQLLPEQYIVLYTYDGIRPLCACGCGKETRFRKSGYFDFSKFIRGHKTQEVKDLIEKKRLKTCLERFGTACSLQSEEAKKKTVKTNMKRYGVDHYSKTAECMEKIRSTTYKRYGVSWYTQLQEHKDKHLHRISWETLVGYCKKKGYEPCFVYDEYRTNRTPLGFKCTKHGRTFFSNVCNVQRDTGLQCPMCKKQGVSLVESRVANFVNSFVKAQRNVKSVISPLELDIYISDKNIAVEFNGLYWHAEPRKPRSYHYDKFKLCLEKGIQLFQIYEDEWRDKKDIWKSLLCASLGDTKSLNKFNARSLTPDSDLSAKILRPFLDENHFQGYARSKKRFALKDKYGEILFCITTREPFTKKPGVIEIARVCSKKFSLVRGGFSRLMKRVISWAKEQGYKEILTYSDCRYSQGKLYKQYGFEFVGHTGIGYDYTDFENRFHRFKFRAQPGKSEKEVAKDADVYRIYNAGNYVWRYLLT